MKFKTYMEQSEKGTYAGVRLSDDDSDYIVELCKELELPNPITKKDIHITLLYSRKYHPEYIPEENLEEWCYPWKFHIFETFDKKRALVLKLKSDYLENRHKYLMDKLDATYDYPEYIPHITLSYDIGEMEQPKFPEDMRKELLLNREYVEDLKLEWKPK